MKIQTQAVVLNKRKYKEYDELVWLYSDDFGVLSAIIHGTKRKKNRFANQLPLYSCIFLNITVKHGLSIINDFTLCPETIIKGKNILRRFTYGAPLCELIQQIVTEKQGIKGLYAILNKLFIQIDQNSHPELCVAFLQQKLLHLTGIIYVFDRCVVCNATKNIIAFSHNKGGILCRDCLDNHENDNLVDVNMIKNLISFNKLSLPKLATLKLSTAVVNVITDFWNDIYENNLGIILKSTKMSNQLKEVQRKND
jgi:DNA repair protein RecO